MSHLEIYPHTAVFESFHFSCLTHPGGEKRPEASSIMLNIAERAYYLRQQILNVKP